MSTQVVRISNEVEIPYLAYNGQPVLTFALIDKVHNRVEGTAKRNFASNRQRFIDGEDYFYITDSKSLDEFRTSHPGILKEATTAITLITESGYLMLVKSFTDDLSWQIQRQLVKLYFRVKEMAHTAPKPGIPDEQWLEILNLIRAISSHCHFKGSAGDAVHERIRWFGGVPGSRLLAPEQFEDTKRELTALAELAKQHFDRWVALDKEFIESVLRPPVSVRKVRALVRRQTLQPSLHL
ncbi:MAG: ORF6N domain-containing protein [Candidatus Competibacter denitrificans]